MRLRIREAADSTGMSMRLIDQQQEVNRMKSKLDSKIKLYTNSRFNIEIGYQFTVSTYKDLMDNVEDIIELFDWYLQGIMKTEAPLVILAIYNGEKESILKYTNKRWEKVKGELREGKIMCVGLSEDFERSDSIGLGLENLSICANLNIECVWPSHLIDSRMPNEVSVFVNEQYIKYFSLLEFEEKMKDMMFRLDGVYGCMDHMGSMAGAGGTSQTPYELDSVGSYKKELDRYDEQARGYFYINALTQKHIDALGGWEYVKANAPCYRVEKLEREGKAVYWLQLTEDINEYDREGYLKLKNFLKPILLKEDLKKLAESNAWLDTMDVNQLVCTDEEMLEMRRMQQEYRERETRRQEERKRRIAEGYVYKEVEFEKAKGFKPDPSCLNVKVVFSGLKDDEWNVLDEMLRLWGNGGERSLTDIWREGDEIGITVNLGGENIKEALESLKMMMNLHAKGNMIDLERMIIYDGKR